jgi:hypothetical protein
MAALELVPLCTMDSVLTEPTVVGLGAGLVQESYLLVHASIKGRRLSGEMNGKSNWDWMTGPGGIGVLRVRALIETDDGASINVRYEARAHVSESTEEAIGYAAPVFSTTSPGYSWLNLVQGVGKGTLKGDRIHWDWYYVAEAH